ncbi:MAG: DUF3857 domain-containing protein [Cytophagales bacterium]|nr:MAG: DUF3857 domain-containing protein [Cytophagales bacterium]
MKGKLLFCALFFFSFFAQAQGPEPHTFGQVQPSDFDIKFEPDLETEAIILQHSLAHRFAYRKGADDVSGYTSRVNSDPTLFSATFIRIKIQKKSALDAGNFVLPYYFDPKNKSYKESYDVLEGYTYNLRGNDIEKTALTQENIADVKIKEDMGEIRITMPKVEEGSIVELRYIRKSPYSRFIEPWEFQGTYPTLFSQFHAQFSSVDFTIASRNHNRPYAPKSFIEKSSTLRSRKDKNKYPEESNMAYYLRTTMNANYETTGALMPKISNLKLETGVLVMNTLSWEAQNVPAFKEEAYMTAMRDHVMSLDFAYVAKATIEGGFSQINYNFLKRYNFEHSLNLRNSTVNEAAHAVADNLSTPLQKVQAMAAYVKNRVALENRHGINDQTRTAKEAFTEKKGNLMQMNLLLVAMLQDIKIEAYI